MLEVSDGGEWDNENRKVKWGPFFDDVSRMVIVRAQRRLSEKQTRTAGLDAFSGTVSFDGVNRPIRVE